jgi:hypothetical protein
MFRPQEARAQMPVRARAFLTIIGYGTAAGTLLGAASLAFGTTGRSVFQGASLGLYAGILFGGYVLVSHHNRKAGNYDDNASPYKDSSDVYGDGYNSEDGGSDKPSEEDSGSFFNRMDALNHKFATTKKGGIPPISVNLIKIEF